MGALDGTLNTPFGPLKKKTGLMLAGGAVLLFGVAYYRSQKASAAAATNAAGASVGVNPATGYIYGSAEDAAALDNQNAYQYGGTGSVGGSGGVNVPITGYVSNAQWSQAVLQYAQNQGLVEDISQLSAALGKYLNGSPVDPTQKSLVEQAIAIQGLPPVPGPAGYPPSINSAPATTTPPPTGSTTTTKRVSVLKDWNVDTWVHDLQAGKEGPIAAATSFRDIVRLNGGENSDFYHSITWGNRPHNFTKAMTVTVGH